MSAPRPITVLRVTTRCRDVDEFMRAFARQIDADSLVVRAANPRDIGPRPAFAIVLADGSYVMRGRAEVMPQPRGRIRLRFLALDGAGIAIRDRILAGGGGITPPSLPPLPPLPAPGEHEPLLTVRMPPLFPEPEPDLAANPFEDLEPVELDVFVDLTLSEDSLAGLDHRPSLVQFVALAPPRAPTQPEPAPARETEREPDALVAATMAPPPPRAPTSPPIPRPTRRTRRLRRDPAQTLIIATACGVIALAVVIGLVGGGGDPAEASGFATPATPALAVPPAPPIVIATPVPYVVLLPVPAASAAPERAAPPVKAKRKAHRSKSRRR